MFAREYVFQRRLYSEDGGCAPDKDGSHQTKMAVVHDKDGNLQTKMVATWQRCYKF